MGGLIYVMGASGCGKDSCMRYAREKLPATIPVVFAHRYITRPADSGGENHVSLSPLEYGLRLSRGFFSLHWDSHGLRYGVGYEIASWMAAGLSVVLNGSREYFSQALTSYPDMVPVEITADPESVAGRLAARGRENPAQARERMHRGSAWPVEHHRLVRIDNTGPLEIAGEKLLSLLCSCAPQ
ncbi:MAG: phosphonate metabolism protein/1,5-bisphosphokinase (PRPP-forming) PhnN [Solidesulfovibrio sp.]